MSREGSCTGYRWDIKWTSKAGDQPNMIVSGDDLEGSEVKIAVTIRTDGGTWIRPLRGDMLRLPEMEPQVCMCVCVCVCAQALLLLLLLILLILLLILLLLLLLLLTVG